MNGEQIESGGTAGSETLIRVLVVDDQAIVRDGLATVLDLLPDVEVVGQAADGEQAVALADELAPDVVLMDLRMPRLDGVGATQQLLARHPHTAVLVLTTFADDASILGALRAGARGYLTKDAGRAEVAAAVRSVAHGQTTLAPEVGARLLEGLVPAASADIARATAGADLAVEPPTAAVDATPPGLQHRFPALTGREAEVLALIAAGRSNPEIARELFVGVATVKTHVNAIFAKLGVVTRPQAIALVLG